VPIVFATGMCPTGLNAFFRQQYRWCTGSTSTCLTSRLWSVPMSIPARLTYVSGFCYYLFTGMSVFVIPLIPISLLLFRPYSITPWNSGLIVVSMLTSMTVLPLWHRSRYDLRATLPLSLVRSWAHALAIWDYLRGKTMRWQVTGAGVTSVRRLWWGIRLWNLTAVMVWLALIGWRMTTITPSRFTIVTISGLINAAIVLRILFPGRNAI
jgi:cellulose synthase (UDP-forming)